MNDNPSLDAMKKATRSRADFSGHGAAKGAAGLRQAANHKQNSEYLSMPGLSIAVSPPPDGFEFINIGVAWDNIRVRNSGFFGKLMKKATHQGVDLDIGCLYEMVDGTRGCIQAFGDNKFGSFRNPPYMRLLGDERTGNKTGYDEQIRINGEHWSDIKRVLVYVYIYEGAPNWAQINPHIVLDVPGEDDLHVTLGVHNDKLALCAVGGLENVRGGIKLTNYTEYFPGHEEMDRAFGFGLEWGDGRDSK